MASLTIAQALATTATGLIIADTPTNIAAALSNASLVSRVSQFTMSGNAAAGAAAVTALAGLGSRFSTNGYRLTVRDTVASLLDPVNSAALTFASAVAVFDSADRLIAAAGSWLMQTASSVLLSTSANLTLAQLVTLESEPAFSVLPGQSITLADSAAHVLALTAAQNRPAIKAFMVSVNSTVSIETAQALMALPSFSVAPGITLTVSGTVAEMTSGAAITALPGIAAIPRTVLTVADSFANLAGSAGNLAFVLTILPRLTFMMTDNRTVSVLEMEALSPLSGHFTVAWGHSLIVADTVAHLLTLSTQAAAMAPLVMLAGDDTATVAQLAHLVALGNYTSGFGNRLYAIDTVAGLAGLTAAERALVSGIIVQDSVAGLLAAHDLPTGTTAVEVLLDASELTAAQAEALAQLVPAGLPLDLQPTSLGGALVVADTLQHLTAASSVLARLSADGPVTISATDTQSVLSASAAMTIAGIGLESLAATITVADDGPTLTSLAGQIFGHGFAGITVITGVFSGTLDQLLDPTLHFAGMLSGVTAAMSVPASAALASNTVANVAQVIALSLLLPPVIDLVVNI